MQYSQFFAEGDGTWMGKEVVKDMRSFGDKIKNKQEIKHTDGTFTWNKEGYYEFNGLIVPNKQALFAMYFKKKLNPKLITGSTWYNSLPDWDATNNKEYLKQKEKAEKENKDDDKPGTRISRAWDAFWQ